MLIQSARNSLTIWFTQLVPALLPFMILSNYILLRGTLLQYLKPQWYCLLIGHLCGYPMGARTAVQCLKQNMLTERETTVLICGSSLPSPAFLITYGILELLKAGAYLPSLLVLLYSSNFILYLLFSKGAKAQAPGAMVLKSSHKPTPMQALDVSITNSLSVMTHILCYMMLCSMVQNVLLFLLSRLKNFIIPALCMLEMSGGIQMIASSTFPHFHMISISMGCMAFGGFCVMAQIKEMLLGTSLSIKSYLIFKCIYSVIVFALCELFFFLIHVYII